MSHFIKYFLVIYSIIISKSLFFTTFNDDLILLIHFGICLICYIFYDKNYFNKFFFYYAFLNVFFLLVHPLITSNFDTYYKNFGNIIRISSFLMIFTILGKMTFLKIYVKCLFVLCLFNLILFIDHIYLFSFSEPISSFFNLLKTYDNIFYENYIFYGREVGHKSMLGTATKVTNLKNPGIFGEGGYYQYFICLALIINLFYFRKSILNKASIIFIITILSTFSTIAYLTLGLILLNHIFSTRNIRKILLLTPFLIVFFVYLFQTKTIYSKLFDYESMDFRFSTIRRMSDTYIDLMIIKEYPWFGIGMKADDEYYLKLSREYGGGTSSSNGITSYASGFGLVGSVLVVYPFILFGFKNKRTFIITACNVLTLLSQEIVMMPMFLLSIMIIKKRKLSEI